MLRTLLRIFCAIGWFALYALPLYQPSPSPTLRTTAWIALGAWTLITILVWQFTRTPRPTQPAEAFPTDPTKSPVNPNS